MDKIILFLEIFFLAALAGPLWAAVYVSCLVALIGFIKDREYGNPRTRTENIIPLLGGFSAAVILYVIL